MTASRSILLCFAVAQEAAPFKRRAPTPGVKIVVTGMGRSNAERSVRAAIQRERPSTIITSGFAGGLNPALANGSVIYSGDAAPELVQAIAKAGAVAGTFHCATRVAITAAEKLALRNSTGLDAVEMESGIITAVGRELGLPVLTVRVISDAAHEDLPLDFNALMNANQEMNYGKLALTVALAPGKIGRLIAFQNCLKQGAENLARVLEAAVKATPGSR